MVFQSTDSEPPQVTEVVAENKWYIREIKLFVRTEEIMMLNEKTLEDIYVNLSIE